jgi:hypothetical protein
MNKTETKLTKAEIRNLKSALSKRQKTDERAIRAHRKTIHTTQQAIHTIERQLSQFTKSTTDRIAILHGRL